MDKIKKNLLSQSIKCFPGGVNSPVRSFAAVGTNPIFVSRASGSKIYDTRGNDYIDFINGWGSLIFGHSAQFTVGALKKQLKNGFLYGISSEYEMRFAKKLMESYPSMDMVRFTNSGTEAVMSAIRTARAYTKREKIVKFEGCYHGHADYLLVKAGSGATTFAVTNSGGVPDDFVKNTIVFPYNEIDSLKNYIRNNRGEIACIIVEPVAGNMGTVLPKKNFLSDLRRISTKYGSVLLFDEIITGFRVARGGAQDAFGIKPDMTCLGKIAGGGLPFGAFGGKKEIMALVSPLGKVYQAGTFSGNPLTMAAGLSVIERLNEKIYKLLDEKTDYLTTEIIKLGKKFGMIVRVNKIASMFTVFFTSDEVTDLKSAMSSDVKKYVRFFNLLFKKGVLFPPSQFESCFLSQAHTDEDLEKTLNAVSDAFKNIN